MPRGKSLPGGACPGARVYQGGHAPGQGFTRGGMPWGTRFYQGGHCPGARISTRGALPPYAPPRGDVPVVALGSFHCTSIGHIVGLWLIVRCTISD